MADFDDITGWRDELAAFKAIKEGGGYYYSWVETLCDAPTKLPYETILHLAELMFAHEEIYRDLKKSAMWGLLVQNTPRGFIDEIDLYGPRNPFDAHMTLGDFRDWYGMKTRCPYNYIALNQAKIIAVDVQNGMFSSVRSPEVKAYYQTQHSYLADHVEF